MKMPKVNNVVKIKGKNITYNIIAYRELSQEEQVFAIRYYHSQKKARKPKNGDKVTIISSIGYDE